MSHVEPETISRLIIDKLIENVLVECKTKNINNILNEHIENYLFNQISPFIKAEFLLHEKGLDKIEESVIFFDKVKITKINTWTIIQEPETFTKDRFASINKLIKTVQQNNDDIKELESEHDIKNNNDIINKEKNNNLKKKFMNKRLKKKILIKKSNIEENDNKIKEKKKEPILEIEGIHIPYENKEKLNIILNDTEENNYLRKEWKLFVIEKEKKQLEEQLRKKKARPKFLMNRELKLFNPNELTFDSNGNILKLQKLNSLQKDFKTSKVTLKNKSEEVSPMQTSSQINKNSLSTNKRKVSEIKLEDINNNEKVEYNLEEQYLYNGDFNFNNKIANQRKKSEKIILSGSNFDKMNPEIGVIISKNDSKIEKKVGGFDYIKKYNRPSMNELSQFLSNSNNNFDSNYNNSYDQIASFLSSYSKNNNKNNNYIGYKEHFSEEKNPLFKNAMFINEEKNKKSRNSIFRREMGDKKSLSNENIFRRNNLQKKNKSNNNILLKEQSLNSYDINNNYLSSVNNILLSNKFCFSNLKSVFSDDYEKNINTNTNRIKNINLGNVRIIKENKSNLIYSLRDIKKENNNILPNINFNRRKNEIEMGQDYINKFLINTIQKRNLSYGNLDNINDINKENSYKNLFLRMKRYNNNTNINKI